MFFRTELIPIIAEYSIRRSG